MFTHKNYNHYFFFITLLNRISVINDHISNTVIFPSTENLEKNCRLKNQIKTNRIFFSQIRFNQNLTAWILQNYINDKHGVLRNWLSFNDIKNYIFYSVCLTFCTNVEDKYSRTVKYRGVPINFLKCILSRQVPSMNINYVF